MQTFNPNKRYTTVGGRPGLAYLQDGYGFDAGYKCLGKFDAQGEPEKKAAAKPTKAATKPEGDTKAQGEPEKKTGEAE